MAALVISPDHMVCGHPWKDWARQALRYCKQVLGKDRITDEDVFDFIHLHETERLNSQRLFDRTLEFRIEEEMRIEEMEFLAFLKKEKPHLHAMYVAHLKQMNP